MVDEGSPYSNKDAVPITPRIGFGTESHSKRRHAGLQSSLQSGRFNKIRAPQEGSDQGSNIYNIDPAAFLAFGKMKAMVEGASIVREELS
jgi:hypothetical protein